MGIISRYFMTEINLETTKSLSKCAAEWAANLITFCRLCPLWTYKGCRQSPRWRTELVRTAFWLVLHVQKSVGAGVNMGAGISSVSPHWERLTKKHGWYKVPFQILAWGLGVNGGPSRSWSLSWLQSHLHGALRSCCHCVKSLYRRKVSPIGWYQASAFPFCKPSLEAGGPNFLGGLLFQQSDSQREGYRHLCTLFPLLSHWLHENDFLKYVAFKINLNSLLNWETALAYEMSL